MYSLSQTLQLNARDFRVLLQSQGPSLGLWRAAEVAALREQTYPAPVLDLGCGDGLVTSLVLDRVDIGLDPDRYALARAAGRGIYQYFEAVPAEASQVPDGSIGTVISNSVLEHLAHIDAVLQSVARMLRPGGRLVFTVPTEAFSAWLALPLTCYAAWRNRRLQHLNLWPVERWALSLRRAGLELTQVRPYLRRPLVTAWDALELLQQVWIARRRVFGLLWRRIPAHVMERMANRAARLDLSAPALGGGRLMVARRV